MTDDDNHFDEMFHGYEFPGRSIKSEGNTRTAIHRQVITAPFVPKNGAATHVGAGEVRPRRCH